ncbi:MAG: DUF6653 family protein [Pseudomonadota bacterium]
MDVFKGAERLMGMDDRAWARHANPWSVWTRFTCLPLLVLAIWSRQWLGWGALPLFLLAAAWTWYNPRAFAPATDFSSWAARATLGERVYLARDEFNVPQHHRRAANVLTSMSAAGLPILIYGLWFFDVWATVAAIVILVLPKVWFCDRMVWLHVDLTGVPMGTQLSQPLLPRASHPTPKGTF